MPFDDPVSKAYQRFQNYFYKDRDGVGLYFWKFIGLDTAPILAEDGWSGGWNIEDPAIRNRVLLMGGHYGDVVIKMMVDQGHRWDIKADRSISTIICQENP